MTHYVEVNGKNIPFPDDWSDEQITQSLTASQESQRPHAAERARFEKFTNMPTPANLMHRGQSELSGGLLNMLKNLMSGGKSMIKGQMPTGALGNIANLLPEELKQGAANIQTPQIDPYKVMGTEEKPFTSPGGFMQLLGELLTPVGAPEALGAKLAPYGEKIMEHLQPGRLAEKFRGGLSEGKNFEGNLGELTKKLQGARTAEQEAALAPKQELMAAHGKEDVRIGEVPPVPNMEKIANALKEKGGEPLRPNEVQALSESIQKYYKHGDVDKLITEIEDHVGHDLSEKQVEKIESLLPTGELEESAYLNSKAATRHYDEAMMETHNKFAKKSSIENGDKMLQSLNKKLSPYYDKIAKGQTFSPMEEKEFRSLTGAHKKLLGDVEGKIQRLPKEMRDKYKTFREKWTAQAEKYEKKGHTLIDELSRGEKAGATQPKIVSQFANHESPELDAIIHDIGTSGKNNILYNYLLKVKPQDARGMADAILEAKTKKGMARYITPEMEELSKELLKRAGRVKAAKYIGTGLGATAGTGVGLYEAYKHL